MKPRSQCLLVTCVLLLSATGMAFAQGTAFTYHGRLNENGIPASGSYDLTFAVFDADTGSHQGGRTLTSTAVAVNNGLFAVTLDFGPGVFDGKDCWLELGVRTTSGGGAFTLLTPRQKLTPTPYAITASNLTGKLEANQLTGTLPPAVLGGGQFTRTFIFDNPANSFTGNGAGLSDVDAAGLNGLGAGDFWQVGGNAGTTAGVNFLGTTDNQPLELKVNGRRALRLEPNADGAPNVIGGAPINNVAVGVVGATISGGGTVRGKETNSAASDFATIGGGSANSIGGKFAQFATISGGHSNSIPGEWDNNGPYGAGTNSTIGGGSFNRVTATDSVISGGVFNYISGRPYGYGHSVGGGYGNGIGQENRFSTIGGGFENGIDASFATIAGGRANRILWLGATSGNTIGGGTGNYIQSIDHATIAGGQANSISTWSFGGHGVISGGLSNSLTGAYSVIPGGLENTAEGEYCFAAGRRANALHSGAFVWADSHDADFASTAPDQFLIRAAGGVGIGSTAPVSQLDVRGNVSIGKAFAPLSLNAVNVLNLQVGATANGSQNGICFFEDANGTGMKLGYDGTLLDADNKLVMYDTSSQPRFVFENGGNLGLGVANPSHPVQHASGAILTSSGVWQNSSDVNRKTDFAAIRPREMLEKLVALRISAWRYKVETESVRHVGPMAQDFKAAFGLGEDDKSIGTVDADGVALAAIQGLNEIVKEQQTTLKQKETEIHSLQKRLEILERAILGPATASNGGGL